METQIRDGVVIATQRCTAKRWSGGSRYDGVVELQINLQDVFDAVAGRAMMSGGKRATCMHKAIVAKAHSVVVSDSEVSA